MITALVFTIVLNGAEAKFGYDYPNEMACNSAISRVAFAGTGKQDVKLECVPTVPGGPVLKPTAEWQAIGVALHANTVQFADRPMNVGVYPDGTSCEELLKAATVKKAGLGGYDIITICTPKAG
jgi:hypothetical protein